MTENVPEELDQKEVLHRLEMLMNEEPFTGPDQRKALRDARQMIAALEDTLQRTEADVGALDIMLADMRQRRNLLRRELRRVLRAHAALWKMVDRFAEGSLILAPRKKKTPLRDDDPVHPQTDEGAEG